MYACREQKAFLFYWVMARNDNTLLCHLMHCSYDEDSVTHRGSFQTRKTFIDVAYNQVDASDEHDTIANNPWINVLSASIVSCVKQGNG